MDKRFDRIAIGLLIFLGMKFLWMAFCLQKATFPTFLMDECFGLVEGMTLSGTPSIGGIGQLTSGALVTQVFTSVGLDILSPGRRLTMLVSSSQR